MACETFSILVGIAGGALPPGTRLPTCEHFASELRENKNTLSTPRLDASRVAARPTAAKASRSVARRGCPRAAAGGTFVIKRPPPGGFDRSDVASLLMLVVREAKLSWVGFIECDRVQATILSRDL